MRGEGRINKNDMESAFKFRKSAKYSPLIFFLFICIYSVATIFENAYPSLNSENTWDFLQVSCLFYSQYKFKNAALKISQNYSKLKILNMKI